jgi:hypothetical protein
MHCFSFLGAKAIMEKETKNQEKSSDNSTLYLGTGAGLGAYATATTILSGVTCPLCVVVAPALIATGIYQKIRNGKK